MKSVTRSEFLNSIGEFSWDFFQTFFVETKEYGNFVWSDPNYEGDNTFTKYDGSYPTFLEEQGLEFARGKGPKVIGQYCGDQIKVVGFDLLEDDDV